MAINMKNLRQIMRTDDGVDPKTVSKRLGHSDTSVTMEIYTHAFEESKNACADRFDEMVKKLENA